jgi:hypothetical protein
MHFVHAASDWADQGGSAINYQHYTGMRAPLRE